MDVPIYKLKMINDSFKATLQKKSDSFFARGNLVGNFYAINKVVIL